MSVAIGKRGMTGKHGNQAKGRRVEYVPVACCVCEKVREYPPGEFKKRGNIKFCSKSCESVFLKIPDAHVSVVCAECGCSFTRDRHRVKERNYCSKSCSAKGVGKTHLEKIHGTRDVDPKWRTASSIREYHREYSEKNRGKINELSKRWAKNNREKRNANQRARRGAGGFVGNEDWDRVCNEYGNLCVCCLEPKKLTLDHIVAVTNGGRTEIDNIQPLCAKCNSSKGAKTIDYRADFKERIRKLLK